MKTILTFLVVACGITVFAQQSQSYSIPPAGVSTEAGTADDWNPTLQVIEHSNPASGSGIQATKDSLAAIYRTGGKAAGAGSGQRAAMVPAAPVLGDNFSGNGFNNGTPNDNEIAIGSNGHLISVQNSNIFRRKTATATNLGTQSLTNWALSLGNAASKYDPKVIYDPEANRFILVCLAGYVSWNTSILIGFSRSDTANGLYNLYEIPGNPFNDTLWSDYPMMAVNQDELFLTINLLHDNQSWQTGFVQTLIWQFNKWDGYAGDTLRTELHSGINYGGRPIRNLCPVEGGTFPSPDPGMYFLSDRNLAASNDTVFLVHVTDTANAPGQQVTVTPLISNISYFMPPNAVQQGSAGLMATNDSRILGAYMHNNTIQFVNNTMDTATGNCSVYHGTITDVSTTPALTANIIGDTALEYGYPNIACMSHGPTGDTSVIVFLHAGSSAFPGVSAVVANSTGYSPRTTVKNGLGYIDVLSGDERWGDYSGIQRRYDLGGTCWVNGMYGLTGHTHATWVAELGISNDVSAPEVQTPATEISVYPNPFAGSVNVTFTNSKAQRVRFVLYDMSGRMVTLLLDDQVKAGVMRFAFSPGPLAEGVYLLRAEAADGSVLFTERIVNGQ